VVITHDNEHYEKDDINIATLKAVENRR